MKRETIFPSGSIANTLSAVATRYDISCYIYTFSFSCGVCNTLHSGPTINLYMRNNKYGSVVATVDACKWQSPVTLDFVWRERGHVHTEYEFTCSMSTVNLWFHISCSAARTVSRRARATCIVLADAWCAEKSNIKWFCRKLCCICTALICFCPVETRKVPKSLE